jgi:hypothetical protein
MFCKVIRDLFLLFTHFVPEGACHVRLYISDGRILKAPFWEVLQKTLKKDEKL